MSSQTQVTAEPTTSAMAEPLRRWREEVRRVDACPYVGPRPQNPERDAGLLIGRDAELQAIRKATLDRHLVVIDGGSGVGKSSLLQNGLLSQLRDSGCAVLVAMKWIDDPGPGAQLTERQVETFLNTCIQKTHDDPRTKIGLPAGADLSGDPSLAQVLEELGHEAGAAVLILDQFEELLRQNSQVAASIIQWIKNLTYRQTSHVVLSLRSDSYYRLEPLLRGFRPFTMDRVTIRELDDVDDVRKVLTTSRPRMPVPDADALIDGEATRELLTLWEAQRPRLLELQATLHSIYFRARARREESGLAGGSFIVGDDVRSFVADAERSHSAGGPIDVFYYGLGESIRLKIGHAEEAAAKAGLDDFLTTGTREYLRRMAPLLSSGGFKIAIQQSELTLRVLARELRVLERALLVECDETSDHGDSAITSRVRRYVEHLREAGDFLTASRLSEPSPPAAGRPPAVTAGPMMGTSASETLFEEVRRVAFAVEWLEFTEIVRKDLTGTVQLTHDGSGLAIREWSERAGELPAFAFRQLTATRGEHYFWSGVIGNQGLTTYCNLSWRECRVTARFRRVTFVNCDFTGTKFDQCEFEGVVFVNCLLDDANLEFCKFQQPLDLELIERDPEEEKRAADGRVAPSFLIEAEADYVQAFGRYRGLDAGGASQLFSDTSGVPAVPGGVPAGYDGEVIANLVFTEGRKLEGGEHLPSRLLPHGGVAFVAGKLCFLTLYRCRSVGEGSVAFRHFSSDGLSVVEQEGGTVEIQDGLLRGISVSRDAEPSAQERHRVDLRVHDSILVNAYFAEGLRGSADLEGSFVLMLLNLTDPADGDFKVNIHDCRYQFLANATVAANSVKDSRKEEGDRYFDPSPSEGATEIRPETRGDLARTLEAMDYRLHPETWERRQRQRRKRSEDDSQP